LEESRHHYAALDGVRGFLAAGVVLYHFGHWFNIPCLLQNFGFAVDTFFCLSGFVLSLSYSQRIHSLSMSTFTMRRLVRLMPLMTIGILISAFYTAIRINQAHETVLIIAAMSLALLNLPYFTAPHSIGGPQVFPLNGPQYSLSLELGVNLLWWAMRGFNQKLLTPVMILTSLPFIVLYPIGGDTSATWALGIPRVIVSFYIGCALFQWRHLYERIVLPPLTLVIAMILTSALLAWPAFNGIAADCAWIFVISPLLVASCANIRLPKFATYTALFAGELSYPVYALHYPLFCVINGATQMVLHYRSPLIEIPMLIVAILMLSWMVLRFVDTPVRRTLGKAIRGPTRGWSYVR